ncbi:MAG TPA: hypothetical protein DCG53_05965, partial [Syntrophus sp. (in: bacteria)]|nr:hypothetical protein [Syntrophus sp. (in: bacteria)]
MKKEAHTHTLASSPVWHGMHLSDIAAHLSADPEQGLSQEEAQERLNRLGLNQLVERGTRPAWRLLLDQFTSVLVIVLVVAAV